RRGSRGSRPERDADAGLVAGGGAAWRAAPPGGPRPSPERTPAPDDSSRAPAPARGRGRWNAGDALGDDAPRAPLRPPVRRRRRGERVPGAGGGARRRDPRLEAGAPPPRRRAACCRARAALVRGRERARDPAPARRSRVVGPGRPATAPGRGAGSDPEWG